MKKIFFIILLCSSFTFAGDLEVIDENIFGVSVQYSLLDLIVPSKYGISGHRNYNGHMFEAEYIRGTMSVPLIIADIGSVTDQRFTVRQRRFVKTRF